MAEANTPEEQVKLNRQLAQMLKGGVIMDVTTPNRHESPKRQAPAQLWHLSASLPTSAQLVASPA